MSSETRIETGTDTGQDPTVLTAPTDPGAGVHGAQTEGPYGSPSDEPSARTQENPYQYPVTTQPAATPTGPLSITSLVLGLASLVAGFTFFVPITGLVLGVLALRREPQSRTMAIWGVVVNAVMLVGAIALAILVIAVGFTFPLLFAVDGWTWS